MGLILTFAPIFNVQSSFGFASSICRGKHDTSMVLKHSDIKTKRKVLKDRAEGWSITYVKSPQHRGHYHVNLQHTNMPPQTNILPRPKLMHSLMHQFYLRSIILQPSLRPVDIRIFPKNLRVALHDPGIDADDGALWYEVTRNVGAAGRDDALVHNGERRMDSEGLVYDSLKIRKGAGVRKADIFLWVAG